eukprot:Em0006g1209a
MPIATPLTTWRAENVSWYKRQDGYKRHLKADYKRSYSFLILMQVIRASNSCHGKLWLLKAGNPRRTFPLRSVFSTFPTDRKFEFKLEIKGNRRLSHVFHLLDDNLSLTYAMNHWMVQSVHTNALHGSSKLQWLAHNY